MRLFLDRSFRLSSVLSSFQYFNWRQLLAFGVREEVRELTSALAWRLDWQVGQLRGAAEEGVAGSGAGAGAGAEPGPVGGQSPEAASAGHGSGAAWHAQEAGEVLLFAGRLLGDALWRLGQGQGGGGNGDSGGHAGSSQGPASDVGSAAEGGAPCGNGHGEPGSGGGSHTSTCSEQHLEEGTHAGPADGAGGGSGGRGSGSGASAAPGGVGPASAVAGTAARGTAMDYGRAAAELWDEVSELLPAAARGALACAEIVLVGGARVEEGGGASEGEKGGGGVNGVGAGRAGGTAGAVAGVLGQQAEKLAQAVRQCYPGMLRCASVLLLAHVGAEAREGPSPWRNVLLGEVQLAGLLGAGVRLWERPGTGEREEGKGPEALNVLLLRLLEMAAVAFPTELRAVVQGEEGAAGEAADGSGGPPAEGSSPPCPAPWYHVSLRAVRDALGGGGGGAELQVVGRVAGGWEPGPGERRALLEEGAGRLAAALWEDEVKNQKGEEAEEGKAGMSKEAGGGQNQIKEEAEGGEEKAVGTGS